MPEYPQVAQLRDAFAEADTLGTMMSGSGPTIFALCTDQAQAIAASKKVTQQINDPDLGLWITKLSSAGIQVANNN